jgi:hypothetical protein
MKIHKSLNLKSKEKFKIYLIGVVLIVGALCADAAIGNVQEKQMKIYKASNVEVVSN